MRKAERVRKTNETDIELAFTIDGGGQADIKTDVPFMTHMLDLFTKHGQFDLSINAKGDVERSGHERIQRKSLSNSRINHCCGGWRKCSECNNYGDL